MSTTVSHREEYAEGVFNLKKSERFKVCVCWFVCVPRFEFLQGLYVSGFYRKLSLRGSSLKLSV